ncbi:MFS transporter [Terrabacter aerolatus]|uniref:MFS transporter n=1 Tax=Terrabacter aerolatus TaxID=422442 RepID=A0A512CXR7_9MICO|nr:MFS transporter [Terrabacter aerolatus]GEO28994.1 MFS transporter [Terrabacter aerolatus]
MDLGAYRPVLANRDTRSALVLGFLIRVPMWAGAVILTLHVVSSLGRSYGEAGLVTAASTVAVAVSGPWRGRLLDRIGLRRTVGPSLVVQAVCWSIAPWVGYAPLIGFAALAGLFVVPTFSILRQVIIRSVPTEQRRTALSLDSSATELSFMAGPAIGVWLATSWDTGWALLVCELTSVAAGFVLWLVNPRLTSDTDAVGEQVALDGVGEAGRAEAVAGAVEPDDAPPARAIRGFITVPVAAVYLAAACSTLVLSGTDVSIVAALRSFQATGSIGWVLALWGAGSLVGGLLYGAWHRSFSVFWLLGGLAATTAPVALAVGVPSFAVLITVSGFLCAPTITATVEQLSRQVPERFRGEMMGWHGSAMTAGSAVGAPVAGFAIDHGGWPWGFVVVSALGVVIAVAGMVGSRASRGARAGAGSEAPDEGRVGTPTRGGSADSEHGASAANIGH